MTAAPAIAHQWSHDLPVLIDAVGPDGTIYVEDSSDLVAPNPDGNEKFRVNVKKKGDEFSNKVSAIANDGSLPIETGFYFDRPGHMTVLIMKSFVRFFVEPLYFAVENHTFPSQ